MVCLLNKIVKKHVYSTVYVSIILVTTIAGWTLQADGTILVPVTSQNTGARSTHAAELEQGESIDSSHVGSAFVITLLLIALTSLSKVSEYVSFMDSKSIKVDLLGKGSSKVSAGK